MRHLMNSAAKFAACLPLLLAILFPLAAAGGTNGSTRESESSTMERIERLEVANAKLEKDLAKLKKIVRGMNAEPMKFPRQFAAELKATKETIAEQMQEVSVNGKKLWLNERDSSEKLNISNNGQSVNANTFVDRQNVWLSVRATSPVLLKHQNSKPRFAFYFEFEIATNSEGNNGFAIGFSQATFPLEGAALGFEKNSIGMMGPRGIWIDGIFRALPLPPAYEDFDIGDVLGIGLIHAPAVDGADAKLYSFVTLNGKYFGIIKLPPAFLDGDLYPTVALISNPHNAGRVNFGENWQFDARELIKDE